MHYSFEVRERAKEVASKNNKMLMSRDCNLLNALLFNRTFLIFVGRVLGLNFFTVKKNSLILVLEKTIRHSV